MSFLGYICFDTGGACRKLGGGYSEIGGEFSKPEGGGGYSKMGDDLSKIEDGYSDSLLGSLGFWMIRLLDIEPWILDMAKILMIEGFSTLIYSYITHYFHGGVQNHVSHIISYPHACFEDWFASFHTQYINGDV